MWCWRWYGAMVVTQPLWLQTFYLTLKFTVKFQPTKQIASFVVFRQKYREKLIQICFVIINCWKNLTAHHWKTNHPHIHNWKPKIFWYCMPHTTFCEIYILWNVVCFVNGMSFVQMLVGHDDILRLISSWSEKWWLNLFTKTKF